MTTIPVRSDGKMSVELLGAVEAAGYSLALDETIAADDPRARSRTSTSS